MHGPLSEIGLIEVFQLLHRGRRSGTLEVAGGEAEQAVTVRLNDGIIVAVEPEAGDAALQQALVARHLAAGKSGADLDTSVGLRSVLATRALGRMIQRNGGHFDFRESAGVAGPLAIVPDDLVFQLVDAETRRIELAAECAQFSAVPEFVAAERLAAGPDHPFSADDWRLLDLVDGVCDIASLARVLDEPVESVAESVRALQGAAILDLRPPAADPMAAAHAAIAAGRFDDAVGLLRQQVDAHPHDGGAWRSLGLAEAAAWRFDRAISAWTAWQAEEPDRAGDAAALMLAAGTMMEALRDHRD
ncbi:MAG: DUF4388 domain-containing protein [Gemmatimonadales bacterium]